LTSRRARARKKEYYERILELYNRDKFGKVAKAVYLRDLKKRKTECPFFILNKPTRERNVAPFNRSSLTHAHRC